MMNRLHFGILLSVGIHLGSFGIPNFSFYDQPQVSVTPGVSRMAMVFVEKKIVEVQEIVEESHELAEVIEEANAQTETEELDMTPQEASQASDGVLWVEPKYLQNPPPVYPRRALLRNIEGKVMIVADIDAEGLPTDLSVEKSSGYSILDKAAVKAIKKWRFVPATRFNHRVPSRTRIPVQFVIGGRA